MGINEYHWSMLSKRTDQGKCTPFIGPQIDESVLPSPEKKSREWAHTHKYPLEDSDVLAKVAQYLELIQKISPKELLSEELQNIVAPNFDLPQYESSPYAILAELPFPIYITTNFDYFMEKALRDKRRNPVTEFCRWNPDAADFFDSETIIKKSKYTPVVAKPLVYHLHGVLDKPDSMVLTEKDYINFIVNLNKENLLPPPIEIALSQTSLLFVGYSLTDIAFRVIFQGISILLKKREATSIAVQLKPSLEESQPLNEGKDSPNATDEKLRLAQEWLSSYSDNMFRVGAYWGTSKEFLQELRNRWNKFRNDSIKQTAGV